MGDAQIGSLGHHRLLESLRMGGAVVLVDVQPIWVSSDHHDLCPGSCEGLRRAAAGCPVGAVQDDLQPLKAHSAQRLQQMDDVPVLSIGESPDPADIRPSGQQRGLGHLRLDLVLDAVIELMTAGAEKLDPVICRGVMRG